MASADLRDELNCSICLSVFTDPVTLSCGHNFCRRCIDRALGTGNYRCPDCRQTFSRRPSLCRNVTLRSIAKHFQPPPGQTGKAGVVCTYCLHCPVPAVKSCVLCEASLCENHLKVHNKSPEHVLTEPTASLENPKSSTPKKTPENNCPKDQQVKTTPEPAHVIPGRAEDASRPGNVVRPKYRDEQDELLITRMIKKGYDRTRKHSEKKKIVRLLQKKLFKKYKTHYPDKSIVKKWSDLKRRNPEWIREISERVCPGLPVPKVRCRTATEDLNIVEASEEAGPSMTVATSGEEMTAQEAGPSQGPEAGPSQDPEAGPSQGPESLAASGQKILKKLEGQLHSLRRNVTAVNASLGSTVRDIESMGHRIQEMEDTLDILINLP